MAPVIAMIGGSSNPRVSGRLRVLGSPDDPDGWRMPTSALVYLKVPGPVRESQGTVPVRWEPLQYECYGANPLAAVQLWQTLMSSLFPDQTGVAQGFIAAHCAVMSVQSLAAGAPIQETPSDFPRVVGTLFVQYCTTRV